VILRADARAIPLAAGSVQCVVTSPPYWGLRDYGIQEQLGLEAIPEGYVAALVDVFREVWRVLRDDGTLWLNLGDCYNAYNGGSGPSSRIDHPLNERNRQKPSVPTGFGLRNKGLKPKDLVGIPWRVAFALQADGWYLRSDIIWAKPNPMPESVTDRPTKAHEYIFLLTKSERYVYDAEAIKEEGVVWYSRNRRSVWVIPSQPYPEAHFATFPEALVEPCVLAGSPEGARVLDPFAGSGTVGQVCHRLGRRFVGLELSPAYCRLAYARTAQLGLI